MTALCRFVKIRQVEPLVPVAFQLPYFFVVLAAGRAELLAGPTEGERQAGARLAGKLGVGVAQGSVGGELALVVRLEEQLLVRDGAWQLLLDITRQLFNLLLEEGEGRIVDALAAGALGRLHVLEKNMLAHKLVEDRPNERHHAEPFTLLLVDRPQAVAVVPPPSTPLVRATHGLGVRV